MAKMNKRFRTDAPTTAVQAAAQIVEGVRNGETRIFVGEDAPVIDWCVRLFPRAVYKPPVSWLMLLWCGIAGKIGRPRGIKVGRWWLPATVVLALLLLLRRARRRRR